MTKTITRNDITGTWSTPKRNGTQHLLKKGWLHRQKHNFKQGETVYVLEFTSEILDSTLVRVIKKKVLKSKQDITKVKDFIFKEGHHGFCSSECLDSFSYHSKSWGAGYYLISERTYKQIKHRLLP